MNFKIKLAGLTIEIESKYPSLYQFCQSYFVAGGEPDFLIDVMAEEIAHEQRKATESGYCEKIAMLRRIAEQLPLFDCLLIYRAAISYGEDTYLFTAPSGQEKLPTSVCGSTILESRWTPSMVIKPSYLLRKTRFWFMEPVVWQGRVAEEPKCDA